MIYLLLPLFQKIKSLFTGRENGGNVFALNTSVESLCLTQAVPSTYSAIKKTLMDCWVALGQMDNAASVLRCNKLSCI